MKIKRALISVYDKEGIVEFGKELSSLGVEILSTGGTAKALSDAGIDVKDVSEHTGSPEIMDGRVKTLHPKIHGGLLAVRSNKDHTRQAEENDIPMIDMVVVNLYPFEETVKQKKPLAETIEMIDIGGPSMLRSAAKNFSDVIAVCDPQDYADISKELKESGDVSEEKRQALAAKVFTRTASYDSAITHYLSHELFPEKVVLSYTKKQRMRYGENPYQDAAFYVSDELVEPCVSNTTQLQGKELSYNNIMDADAAIEIVKEFTEPCVSVIKHANPSGVAVADTIEEALEKAYNADALSAFGCIIAMNRPCNKACAEFLKDKFVEVIISESFDDDALELFSAKKNLRLLTLPDLSTCYKKGCRHEKFTGKKVIGGLLAQTRDFPQLDLNNVEIVTNENPTKEDVAGLTAEAREGTLKQVMCVTKKQPTKEQLSDMVFAMKVCKHVKSNTVLYAKGLVTVGIGAGQMSRVDSAIIAARKSEGKSEGAVLASDAFFPFRDGIDEAAKAGITAVIQPGGSVRDKEVIDAANEHGIAMVFTGTRLFLH